MTSFPNLRFVSFIVICFMHGVTVVPTLQDDENDMLDMAFGLTDTSRLGCQVRLTRDLDGITATLPAATRNMFVDGASTVLNDLAAECVLVVVDH